MLNLDDELYEKISEMSDLGNSFMDDGEYPRALKIFEEALDLLPAPRNTWEAYTWLKAGIADALFSVKDYERATEELYDAMNGPDGASNPFILLRLGQSLYEQSKPEGIDFLCKAYMLEGEEIFSEEDGKYLALVKDRLATNQSQLH
ncbi:tetratricopeptide repeat protein [Pseudomonas syringae USA007]|uniref:Tetratricopeptide repeat protein n=1 Tax=Pseudomonas syringae USA007 TaxID=1357288 RepID=A0AAU8M973_PSESX|nr:tetratricopeptide repeat protein [Pseudomonas syringae]